MLRRARGVKASLLVVQERGGRTFGAFIPSQLARSEAGFYGDARTFLFMLTPRRIFRATGRDDHFVHMSATHGIGFGGEIGGGGFALHLGADLLSGRCLPSHTFGAAASLSSSRDFAPSSVQLWDATPPEHAERLTAHARSWDDAANADTVLQPGPNKLMLEFVGMEKEVAMLRRFSG
uniref:Oxidation resistance protein 1 n=2 Tax=Chrysotila carterae TaxID=13221 RepID=A0A7S4BD16_CHRCT